MEQIINVERMEQIINLFGALDENIKLVEQEYDVTIVNRDTELKIVGEPEQVVPAKAVVDALLALAARGEQISQQNQFVWLLRFHQVTELAAPVGAAVDVRCDHHLHKHLWVKFHIYLLPYVPLNFEKRFPKFLLDFLILKSEVQALGY